MKRALQIVVLSFFLPVLVSCVSVPEGIEPVSGFKLEPYLGTWYEIARLDHRFERNLSRVTATYEKREQGGITVINRGYNTEKQAWSEAEGKAFFVDDASTAHLKVSFFGPFYASYVVFELGENYDYAFVTGNKRDYLWLLARTPTVDDALKQRFTEQAASLGFDLADLVWVAQP